MLFNKVILSAIPAGSVLLSDDMSSRPGGDVSIDMDSVSDRQRYQQQLQLIEEQVCAECLSLGNNL